MLGMGQYLSWSPITTKYLPDIIRTFVQAVVGVRVGGPSGRDSNTIHVNFDLVFSLPDSVLTISFQIDCLVEVDQLFGILALPIAP